MPADPASATGSFVSGLLDPTAPLPETIKGRPPKRYAVYRNNVTISLVRAMESNFPVIRRLLGEQYFAGLAREFVQQHPPHSPLMFEYGEAFRAYLSQQDDLSEYPYLSDIAKLEQQMRLSYHEADAPCVSAESLATVGEDALMLATLTPHPAAAIVTSSFAIHTIWQANTGENGGIVANPSDAQSVLITRPQYDVMLCKLDDAQLAFFAALRAGHPLGQAADAAFAAQEDFDLARAIGLLLTAGAFQSIHTVRN